MAPQPMETVCKLYLTQSLSTRASLRDLSLTNHSQRLDHPLHAAPQSDQSQAAIRLYTAYNMPLQVSGFGAKRSSTGPSDESIIKCQS